MQPIKWNVVFEQYVIPHYRVPFFARLAQETNLTVIASDGVTIDGLSDIRDNLPFESLRFKEALKGSGFHAELFDVLAEKKADAYISYGALLTYLLWKPTYWKKIKASGAKIFWMGCDGYWVRNFWLEKFKRWAPWNPKRIYRSLREAVVVSRTDGFICHSTHMAEYFRIVHGVPRRKIFLAQNAIDTSALGAMREAFRKQGIAKHPGEIVFVGRLAEGKCVDVLLRAFARTNAVRSDASLKIIGEGSAMENLQALARELGIAEKVRFMGGIYDEALLAKEMYTAALYALPGLGGLGINTAMAMGLPIVCSYADGTEEDLVTNGANGWRFDGSEDALVRTLTEALADPARLLAMGEKSADIIEHRYNLENMVNKYVQALTTILNELPR